MNKEKLERWPRSKSERWGSIFIHINIFIVFDGFCANAVILCVKSTKSPGKHPYYGFVLSMRRPTAFDQACH